VAILGLFDHVGLGGLSAALALYLVSLGRSCLAQGGARWPRLALAGTLLLLALDVQGAALLLLLRPDGTQDGVLHGDVRLRNALSVAVVGACWVTALVRFHARRDSGTVVHSEQS
jgi:hypothetical protein